MKFSTGSTSDPPFLFLGAGLGRLNLAISEKDPVNEAEHLLTGV